MLLSVVLSFRNEEEVLEELTLRLAKTLESIPVSYELIFINDSSTDRSLEILNKEAAKNKNIKVINMSRVFGITPCIMAGLKYSKGDAVVYMDADLQDPPELIPEILAKFKAEKADVVYTTRLSREGESPLKMWVTKIAYRILRYTSKIDLPVDSGDFKLMSRRVVNELIQLGEKNPLVKGLVSWVGFKQVPFYYHRAKRFAGKTHHPFFKGSGIQAFLFGLTAFSTLPLNIILLFGFVLSFLSFFFLAALLVMFFLGVTIPTWTAILVALLIFGGSQMVTLGFLGIYLGRIYEEVKRRPNYVVESTLGL